MLMRKYTGSALQSQTVLSEQKARLNKQVFKCNWKAVVDCWSFKSTFGVAPSHSYCLCLQWMSSVV